MNVLDNLRSVGGVHFSCLCLVSVLVSGSQFPVGLEHEKRKDTLKPSPALSPNFPHDKGSGKMETGTTTLVCGLAGMLIDKRNFNKIRECVFYANENAIPFVSTTFYFRQAGGSRCEPYALNGSYFFTN